MHECTKHGGCGLNCEFKTTGDPLLIKFHNLLDHPKDIMFWSSTDSMKRLSHICRKLKDMKDPNRQSIIALRYLDEYYSDATPTVNIIGHVQSFFKDNESLAIAKVVQKSEILTDRLVIEGE